MTIQQAMRSAEQFLNAGRPADAEALCRQILAAEPDNADAMFLMGQLAEARQDWVGAIGHYQKATLRRPDVPYFLQRFGQVAERLGRAGLAVTAYRNYIALDPRVPEAHTALARVLERMGQWDPAADACRAALRIKSDHADAYVVLGLALKGAGRSKDASAAIETATRLNPAHAEAWHTLSGVLMEQGRIEQSVSAARRAVELDPNHSAAQSHLLMMLHLHPGSTRRSLFEEHARWNRQCAAPAIASVRPHANSRDAGRRLKLGYLSPDFRLHAIASFLLPLMQSHDRGRFEIVCYAEVSRSDGTTTRFRQACDEWHSIVGLGDERVAEQIRRDGIDLLVDLTLHAPHNRLGVFARKPAPVQVTYLGYCGTTGLQTIDYRLSDRWLDPGGPGGMDESCYSERTVRLPNGYWCYRPIEPTPDVNGLPAMSGGGASRRTLEPGRPEEDPSPPPSPGVPGEGVIARTVTPVTFGSLNVFNKVTDGTLDAWAKILRGVPGSRMILHAPHPDQRDRVLAAMRDLDPTRLTFVGRVALWQYFQLYQRIDIALDSFPVTGGTTTCDALWMGVPVVSLAGETAVSRGGLSLLSAVGLEHLVANDVNQYVQIATDLASQTPWLAEVRRTLRQTMLTSPLTDVPRFTKDVETIYRRMWRTWCEEAGRG